MIGLDTYSIAARYSPSVIALLPAGLSVAAWFPPDLLEWGAITGFLGTTGLAVLLAEVGRDPGKKKEPALFELWGGKPTTQLLRHRDPTIDPTTKRRYHDCLGRIVPNIQMPSAQGEADNPGAADEVYDSCVRFLLERTRDRKRFRLVFRELVSYGFRRNLWGRKPMGVTLAAAGIVAAGVRVAVGWPAAGWAVLLANALLLAAWLAWIKPESVRLVAFTYARALLAACDQLCGRAPAPD